MAHPYRDVVMAGAFNTRQARQLPGYTSLSIALEAARGVLLFQRCSHCGKAVFNPAAMCRVCGGAELVWEESKGRGTVYSWTVAWRPQHPACPKPYAAAIVELAEGCQMLANVGHCRVEDLSVGLAVQVLFAEIGEGFRLPCFAPVRQAG